VKKRIEHRDREVKIRTHTEEELKLLLKMLERRVDERTQELDRSRAEAIRMMEEPRQVTGAFLSLESACKSGHYLIG